MVNGRENFLNSIEHSSDDRLANRYMSIWTKARQASKRLGVTWRLNSEQRDVELVCGEAVIGDRRSVFRDLRRIFRKKRTLSLREHKQQGKTNDCVAAARESSHFLFDGTYTTFKDWRFVHRARLSLFNLNAYNRPSRNKPGPVDKRCRRCGQPETLPHVLDHCMAHSTLMKKRHNAIIDRVKKACGDRWTIVSEDRAVGNSNLRPDLVIQKGSDMIVIDVTVPFDNGLEAFEKARQEKIRKYTGIAQELSLQGRNVAVEAIVVGALGSWDPANDRVMRRICSKKYLSIFKKIVVSETIAYSRDIYDEHIRRVPQDSNGRRV